MSFPKPSLHSVLKKKGSTGTHVVTIIMEERENSNIQFLILFDFSFLSFLLSLSLNFCFFLRNRVYIPYIFFGDYIPKHVKTPLKQNDITP